MKWTTICFLGICATALGQVTVQFNPADPQTGPYPSDVLTVVDAAQVTGRRVNLPLPDCDAQPTVCAQMTVVNQLDGFNVQPRIRVTFSGAINPDTLKAGILFVAMDNLTNSEVGLQAVGDRVGINQIVWDPATNSAYAKPELALDQHRSYLLAVTDALKDPAGNPVAADAAFGGCDPAWPCPAGTVAAVSFTTMSATAWMESARRQLESAPVTSHRLDGQAVFDFTTINTLTANFDLGGGKLSSLAVDVGSPTFSLLFGAIGKIAFGSYTSPQFLNPGQFIDAQPTGADAAWPAANAEIAFHVFLPATPPPPGGYPVVIFGHGFGDSSIGGPTIVAPAMAQAGFATIAINAVGHGFGPGSNIVLTDKAGVGHSITLGGRGVDLNGDGTIDATEGCVVTAPVALGLRDCLRQTSLDLAQLTRVIRAGLDLDGDGVADLDPLRIYYIGQSLGSMYGTVFNAIEPSVRAAVLNVGGGSVVDITRWSPSFSPVLASFLPAGLAAPDNYPFRDQPVRVLDPGSADVQNFLELIDWAGASGDPLSYAPHLSRSTLPGGTPKRVLAQIARADQTMPNPASSALIRAAGLQGATWLYRHDLAQVELPGQLPVNPHTYLALFLGANAIATPSFGALIIGLGAQNQAAQFFGSDGKTIPDMNQILPGTDFFEQPVSLPDDLGYK